MSTLLAIAITTGILSGIWGWLSVTIGLLTWVGFLGCTSFFASPIDGVKGLYISLLTNLSGVFWAMVAIHGSEYISIDIISYVVAGLIAFIMCIQAKQGLLNYLPGTFIGSCATFATDGNWKLVIPSIVLGAIFGYVMKVSGLYLSQRLNKSDHSIMT